MKKLCFTMIVALLALAVFSCDGFIIPKDETNLGIDAWDLSGEPPLQPGEFFIGFNTGSNDTSRALTLPLAKAGSDYFEAVFTNGTLVHRSVFKQGKYGRMMAPANGNYNNVTGDLKAYLFAGRDDDKTLLGIGIIKTVDNGNGWLVLGTMGGGSGTGGEVVADDLTSITQATRGVYFFVEPLLTDVTTEPDTPGAISSSTRGTFRPWSSGTGGTGTGGTYSDVAKRIQIDNLPASIFLLPAQASITADYDVLTSHAAAITLPEDFVTLDPASYPLQVIPNGYIWSDGDYAPIEVPTDIDTTSIAKSTTKITFPLIIKTNDTSLLGPPIISSGLGTLSLNVPVVNLSDKDADNQQIPDLKLPVIWYIRGGMNNVLIDQGKDFNEERGSLGGAILIGVGNVLSGNGGFIIKAGYTPAP